MDPRRLEILAAAYAEGTIDEAAAAELLQAVETDPDVRREVQLHVRTDRLLRAARRVDPEPVLRALASRRASHFSTRILRRLSRRPATPAWKPWIFVFAGAAAALLAVAPLIARRPAPHRLVPAGPPDVVRSLPSENAPPAPPEPSPAPEPFVPPLPLPRPDPVPFPAPVPVPVPLEPAPRPGPAPLPEAKPTVAVKAIAALEGGRELLDGERIAGPAAIRYPDGTRLELSEGGEIRVDGARVERGLVSAVVAKQPAGRFFTLSTPAAEVVVLGTRFTLRVDAGSTVLEVQEGRVRLKRADGFAVEVGANQTATAAKGVAPAVRPLVRTLAFQDGVSPDASYAGTRDTTIAQVAPAENRGADSQLHLHRPVEGIETSLLRFDLSAIPPGSRVVAAELTLFVTGALAPPGWKLHELRRPWEELEASWKTWPSAGERGRPLGLLAPASTGLTTIPLSEAVVQQWIAGPNFGLVFVPVAGSARWGIESRETARPDRRPRLTVSFYPSIR